MTKTERQKIFDKFNGRCAYCGCELRKGWHVDELKPVQRQWRYKLDERGIPGYYAKDSQGNRIKEHYCEHPENYNFDNQMPACASCNINKHSMSLEEFRDLIHGFMKHLNTVNTQYKVAKRYGLVSEDIKPVVFYFEKINTPNQ